MSVYEYGSCIQITFDKPIVVDPEVVTGTEYVPVRLAVTDAMVSVSSSYSGRLKVHAIDGDFNTRWETSGAAFPQWFATDFGVSKNIGKIRVYVVGGQYPVSAYTIQGSDDNSTWTDITSGTIANATQWTDIVFPPVSHRYWRFYITAGTSGYACIYEIQFFGVRNKYRTDGWEVYAQESDMSPEGTLSKTVYTVRKVTRSEDNFSIFLWLDLFGRMKNPQGNVTVKFTGSLIGLGYANVAPFQLTFTPTEMSRVFCPLDRENLTASTQMTCSTFDVTYRYNKNPDENLTALTNMSIVITNVGGLPL